MDLQFLRIWILKILVRSKHASFCSISCASFCPIFKNQKAVDTQLLLVSYDTKSNKSSINWGIQTPSLVFFFAQNPDFIN
jgi:hypothetical protein